jgi:hypothetical protein
MARTLSVQFCPFRGVTPIAAHLNAEGYPTRDGSVPSLDPETGRTKGGWSAVQVKRVLDRARTA